MGWFTWVSSLWQALYPWAPSAPQEGMILGALFDAAYTATPPRHAFVNTAFVIYDEEENEVQVSICRREGVGDDGMWLMEEEIADPVRQALQDAGFRGAHSSMLILNRPASSVVKLLTSWGMVDVTQEDW